MHGCGNDFILIDNRELKLPVEVMDKWATALCPRAFSIGADGLIFLEDAPADSGLDYRWHFYNADGSRAEMCGNASRCTASLALQIGLAGEAHVFGTDAGPIRARVLDGGSRAKVQLTEPVDQRLDLDVDLGEGTSLPMHFVNTGVPHAVHFADEVKDMDVARIGASVRYSKTFAPAGTNANFAAVHDSRTVSLRTYERGVEAETFACGTGAAATVVLSHALGLTGPEVNVTTTGGEVLGISIEEGGVFLSGAAAYVYEGSFDPSALGLPFSR